MGLVCVEGVVRREGRAVRVRFLVDSGATYTVLSEPIWKELGPEPKVETEFLLADGTAIRRRVSESLLEQPGYGERHTPVVLREPGDGNLLGAVTLEVFGLVLDPSRMELRPMRTLTV